MYLTLLFLNLMMSILFLFMNHPMSMGLILMIQTITISLMSGLFSYSFWFSYILFLIMVGGMLILFMYMTSLASNEMFSMSKKLIILSIIMIIMLTMIYMIYDKSMLLTMFKNTNMNNFLNNLMFLKNENMNSLNMIYNKPNMIITFMLINYLLLTLIAIVKIINMKYGPLRQKF